MSKESFFKKGHLSVVMDGGYGSSGKGKMASYVGEKETNWTFACNAFMSNAAHTVVSDYGTYNYQCLNSVAYLKDKYERTYICGGAVIELPSLLQEIEANGLNERKLGIHPLVAIVQDKDIGYERGTHNFDGDTIPNTIADTMKIGSTLHGVGAARARRILRRSDVLLARDIPELAPFLCDTRDEILTRLESGQSGLMEIAQGWTLGYLETQFYPRTTSRNCSVSAALDDCGLPPWVIANVMINFRTYPIRVNSNKWLDARGNVLKYDEAVRRQLAGEKIVVVEGNSGPGYPDQVETTWDEVTKLSGSNAPIFEKTTLTGNPRRVFTFSQRNVEDAIRYNYPANGNVWLSINFMNYVDTEYKGDMTDKVEDWLDQNIPLHLQSSVRYLGYGAHTHETVDLLDV